jgi:hypothetical protein
MQEPSTEPKPRPTDEDGGFDHLVAAMQSQFAAIAGGERPLFTTDLTEIFASFLASLPPALHRHYTCNCCRRFLDRFGGLVVVGEDGQLASALWPDAAVPAAFAPFVAAMRAQANKATITGVFLTSDGMLGTPLTGEWPHLAVPIPADRRHQGLVSNANQVAAGKKQDLGVLKRGLDEFDVPTVRKALDLLTTGGLYRSDKAEGVVHWVLGLHEMRSFVRDDRLRENLLWVAAATAPPGFCQIRSSMIGTLLEDITADLPFDTIKERWATKMAPSQYMRAQAAPSAGNIAQAEKIIATLKAAGALGRRYAHLAELPQILWRAPAAPAAPAGVFSHLTPKARPAREPAAPPVTMSWETFAHTVLPEARLIEAQVPTSPDRFVALVTAAEPGAPPILQWDSEQARNPFSWYYAAGIDAEIRRRVLGAGGTHENCDIRASLLWNNRNDLDLHVIAPSGEHIYFSSKKGKCGGWLDVDMNVSGNTDTPVENIRWTRGVAPDGRYRFYVQNYRFHEPSRSPTPFRVELEVNGEVFHHDSVISPSQQTGAASDLDVAVFDHVAGQKLGTPPRGMRSAQDKSTWNLVPGQWTRVSSIVPSPNLWGDRPLTQHGQHLFFLLDGCRDTVRGTGRGFFVETLRSEFHPIRSTLEAYAASADIAGAEEADACGLGMSDQSPWNLALRVTTPGAVTTYLIDTWR